MNKVILQGRMVADPAVYITDRYTLANFTLACNRTYKEADGTIGADYISCQASNRNAELIAQYFKKGSAILVEGEWRTGTYEKDGVTHYTNRCNITRFDFLPRSGDQSNLAESEPVNQPAPQQYQTPSPKPVQQEELGTIPQAFDIDLTDGDDFPF